MINMKELAQINIGEKFGAPLGQTQTLGDLVSTVLNASLVIAGIIVLFLLIFGGFYMIAGAGEDNPEKAAKGRQAATAAVIGFIIIFVAYWIIRLIEIITGYNFITNPGI